MRRDTYMYVYMCTCILLSWMYVLFLFCFSKKSCKILNSLNNNGNNESDLYYPNTPTLYYDETFLAHLSRRLKWAFLIKICPLSVVVVVVVVVVFVVNFSHFHLLLQNHSANFKQTWHKTSLAKRDSNLFKWRALFISNGR